MNKCILIIVFLLFSALQVYSKSLALHNEAENVAWSPFNPGAPVDYPVDFGLIGLDYDPFLPMEVRGGPPGWDDPCFALGADCDEPSAPVGDAVPVVLLFAGFYASFVMFKKRKQKQNINAINFKKILT